MNKQESAVPVLIVVHGDKGGVGKSTVSRVLSDWLSSNGIAFVGYDGDPSTGDFARYVGAAQQIDVADIESVSPVLDQLMDAQPGQPRTALIDLSARAGQDAMKWLTESGALDAAERGELAVAIVFVLGPTASSAELLVKAVTQLKDDRVRWIVAMNEHLSATFDAYEASPARALAAEVGAIEIRIPALDPGIMRRLELDRLSFAGAIDPASTLGFTRRNYVRHFVDDVFGEFDRAGAYLGVKPA